MVDPRRSAAWGNTSPIDNGVDMRTMLTIAGVIAGAMLTVTVQRHAPHVVWWLFGNGE